MKFIIIGYGATATALLPILFDEFGDQISSLTVIDPLPKDDNSHPTVSPTTFVCTRLTIENYKDILIDLDDNTFLINLSVDVSSLDLVAYCQERGAKYLDTCIEPWAGYYTNTTIDLNYRTNYHLRESMLALKRACKGGPTAVIAHGANPGLASHFVKQALLHLRHDLYGANDHVPTTRQEWAQLACDLHIKTIHIAEHDTQIAKTPKTIGEFINTWSVDGFIAEGCQPSELGWGTHELKLPIGAHFHESGCKSSIYLTQPGASVRIKTWTPAAGPCLGFLITHNESISLSDYLTVHDENGVSYRPTVNYAYHPCNDAILSLHELIGNSWQPQQRKRVISGNDILEGADYLGVLLMGHEKNAYWYGSALKNCAAQALNPQSSATTLQVVAGVIAGIRWALENPRHGIVEAEEIDFQFILGIAQPYLGELVGAYTNWSPDYNAKDSLYPSTYLSWQFEKFLEHVQDVQTWAI